jgi:hypothetical protein
MNTTRYAAKLLIIDCCQWVVLEKLLNNRERDQQSNPASLNPPFTPLVVEVFECLQHQVDVGEFFHPCVNLDGMENKGHLRKKKKKKVKFKIKKERMNF